MSKSKTSSQEGSYKDPEVLRRLHWEQEMSQAEMGDELGVSQGSIQYWMEKLCVERRSRSEAQALFRETPEDLMDMEKIRELYWDEGMTLKEIADELGCIPERVRYWMEKHGIKRRSKSEACEGNGRVERATYFVSKNYPKWTSRNQDGTCDQCCVSQLLACLDNDPNEVFAEGTIVHHKNKCPRDNRVENLEVMTRSQHNRHHNYMKKKAEYLDDYATAMETRVQPVGMADW